jgi:hypothetical protein
VSRFLGGGKGVVLLVDRPAPVISGFLRELGIETLSEAGPATAAAGFRYVYMEHGIFQPFRSADFGNLTEITVKRYRRLRVPGAMPLVFSAAGDPLMFESAGGKGRLLVLAFSLDRTETNWPLHPTFIPFLDRCLQHARSEPPMQTDFQPGEVCVWKIPADRQVSEVVLRAAERTDDGQDVRRAVEDGQARLRIPDEPGVYALSYDAQPGTESLLAVNPSPKESDLRYSGSPDAIGAWRRETDEQEAAHQSAGLGLELSKPEVLRQRIWWWLVLGGLAVLLIEAMWLSIRKVRA